MVLWWSNKQVICQLNSIHSCSFSQLIPKLTSSVIPQYSNHMLFASPFSSHIAQSNMICAWLLEHSPREQLRAAVWNHKRRVWGFFRRELEMSIASIQYMRLLCERDVDRLKLARRCVVMGKSSSSSKSVWSSGSSAVKHEITSVESASLRLLR